MMDLMNIQMIARSVFCLLASYSMTVAPACAQTITHVPLFTFDGDAAVDSSAGDINGDGVADFFVGATVGGANNGGYARVFVSQIILLGDCNLDGVVDFSDIAPFVEILQAGSFLVQADCNQDDAVNFADIPAFIEILIAVAAKISGRARRSSMARSRRGIGAFHSASLRSSVAQPSARASKHCPVVAKLDGAYLVGVC